MGSQDPTSFENCQLKCNKKQILGIWGSILGLGTPETFTAYEGPANMYQAEQNIKVCFPKERYVKK